MEGFYIAPDCCFQLIQPVGYDINGDANQWYIYGMKDTHKTLVDWTAIVHNENGKIVVRFDKYNVFKNVSESGDKNNEDGDQSDDPDNEDKSDDPGSDVVSCIVRYDNDMLIWPDDTAWKKIIFSNRQLYIINKRRPTFITSLLISLLMVFCQYIYAQLVIFKDYLVGRMFTKKQD